MSDIESTITKEAVSVLDKLEHATYSRGHSKMKTYLKKNKSFSIYYSDIAVLDYGWESLYAVSNFLQEKGLKFVVTFDFINDHPTILSHQNNIPEEEIEIGYIDCDDLITIRQKIIKLKNNILKATDEENKKINIVLYSKDDVLDINSVKISVSNETLERVLLDVLVDNAKKEVSWDEILDIYDGDSNVKDKKRKKEVGDARMRLNKKIIKNTSLKSDLVKRRKDNYSLSEKVTKK